MAYYYFNSSSINEGSTTQFLTTTTRQLAYQGQQSLRHLQALFAAHNGNTTSRLTIAEREKLLHKVMSDFDEVTIILDALDESQDPEEVINVLSSHFGVHQDRKQSFIATSRNELRIERILNPLVSTIIPLIDESHRDLKEYIDHSVDMLISTGSLRLRNHELADIIKNEVLNKAAGLFLQARFHLDSLPSLNSDRAIKKALQELPGALDQTYEQILLQIKNRTPARVTEAMTMLMWLTNALQPLTPDMLAEVVAIGDGDMYLDRDGVATDPERLIEILGSLVFLDRKHNPPIISLSHLSVSDYLHSDRIRKSLACDFAIEAGDTHRYLAKVSVQYLGFRDFSQPAMIAPGGERRRKNEIERGSLDQSVSGRADLSPLTSMTPVKRRLKDYAMLAYVAQYWPKHIARGFARSNDPLFEAMIAPKLDWFLFGGTSRGSQFDSWRELHYFSCNKLDDCEYGQGPLLFSIMLGIDLCFDRIFNPKTDLDFGFAGGWSPLTAAAYGGSTYIVQRMLDSGADIDQRADEDAHNGFTALHLAAEGGDAKMVQLLLSRGASVHTRTFSETTPLYRATRKGSIDIINALLQAGSDVNALTWDNFTPIIEPAMKGDLIIVELLLRYDADPLLQTDGGYCAVDLAAEFDDTAMLAAFEEHLVLRDKLNAFVKCKENVQRRFNKRPVHPVYGKTARCTFCGCPKYCDSKASCGSCGEYFERLEIGNAWTLAIGDQRLTRHS